MSNVTLAWGTETGLTPSGWNSLANSTAGAGSQSAGISVASNVLDIMVRATVVTASSGTSATGFCQLFAIGSLDSGTTWTDAGSSSAGALTVNNAVLIAQFNTTANSTTYYSQIVSTAQAFGWLLPQNIAYVLVNQSGSTLAASGNVGQYQVVYATVI